MKIKTKIDSAGEARRINFGFYMHKIQEIF